jgi:hypothetical protein
MVRASCYSLITLAVLTASSGAHERAHHNNPSIQPGARASVAETSQPAIYRQCEEQARLRWGTNSQDMQTPRDFDYRACMFDRGMRNP